jgi:hypothetical protein
MTTQKLDKNKALFIFIALPLVLSLFSRPKVPTVQTITATPLASPTVKATPKPSPVAKPLSKGEKLVKAQNIAYEDYADISRVCDESGKGCEILPVLEVRKLLADLELNAFNEGLTIDQYCDRHGTCIPGT